MSATSAQSRKRPLVRWNPSKQELLVLCSLLALALALPVQGRVAGVAAITVVALVVGFVVKSTGQSIGGVVIATLVGLAPVLALLGFVADLIGVASVVALRALVAAAWLLSSVTLGTAVVDRLATRRDYYDVLMRIGAVLGVTGFVGGALGRLLLPSRGTDLRLAWMLGEEDNAAFVGIAREVLTSGHRGGPLAEEFGSAFMNLPLAILRLAGGPLIGEDDVRLQAVSLATLSAVVAIAIAGLSMALIAALPHHVHRGMRRADRAPNALGLLVGAAGSAAAALAGLSLLAVLPLQAGFLSFLWGLSLVLLATAVVSALPGDAESATRFIVLGHLGAVGLLILGSWAFVLAGLAPLALLPLTWIDRARLQDWWARNRSLARSLLASSVALVIGAAWLIASLPQVSRATELGMDLLTIGGSSIHVDRWTARSALAMVALAVILLTVDSGWRSPALLALVASLAGVGALMLGIRIATDLFVGGVMAYAGFKLLFGLIALTLVIGSLGLTSAASRFHSSVGAMALVVVMTPHVLGGTATAYEGWWDRTERPGSMHAIATVAAIRASTPDVPIRCLPSPGTRIDGVTPWAAYFCIRWMEEGFNEGRFGGNAGRFLNAQGDDFGELVDSILAEQQSEYLFAYRMTMGPGWFGWTGP